MEHAPGQRSRSSRPPVSSVAERPRTRRSPALRRQRRPRRSRRARRHRRRGQRPRPRTPRRRITPAIARTCRASDRIDDRGPRQAGGGRRLLGRDCERLADPGDGVAAPKRPVVTAGAQPEHHGRESGVAQLGRELDVLLAEERVVGADVERDGVACPRALDADHDRLTARRLDGRGELLDRAVRRRRRRHRGGSR